MKAREKRRKRAQRKANRPMRLARAADVLRLLYEPDDATHLLFRPASSALVGPRLTRARL